MSGEHHTVQNCHAEGTLVTVGSGDCKRSDPTPSQCTNFSKNGKTTIVDKNEDIVPYPGHADCGTGHARCDGTLVKNCTGKINVGSTTSSKHLYDEKVINTTLDSCAQAPNYAGLRDPATIINQGGDNVTATQVTTSEVGPLADL